MNSRSASSAVEIALDIFNEGFIALCEAWKRGQAGRFSDILETVAL